jgi:hypothetical protein
MFVCLATAFTVVRPIKFVFCWIFEFELRFGDKISFRSNQIRIVHGPLLDRLLLFHPVVLPISSVSVGIKVVAVWVKIVPCGKRSRISELSFKEGTMRAVSFVRHSHRMLVESSDGHHFIEVTMIWKMILSIDYAILRG